MSWHPANGLRTWLLQRLSAVYMAVYFVAVIIGLTICFPADFDQWRSSVANPFISVATAGFFISLMYHAWVGMRDAIIDYIHPTMLRFICLSLLSLGLLLMCLWSMRILISVIP